MPGYLRITVLLIALLSPLAAAPPALAQPEADSPAASPAEAPPADAPETALDSPRAAMFTFLDGFHDLRRTGDQAHWDRILATLQAPADMPPQDQRGAAEAILESLDKLGTVSEDDLPGEVEVRLTGATRYTFFPGSPDQAWVWEALKGFGAYPQGTIELVQIAAGEWRFSAATVRDAVALAESLRPLPPRHFTALIADDEVTSTSKIANLLGPTFTLTPWWGWLALLGLIFAGLAVGRMAKAAMDRSCERWRRADWLLWAVAVEALGDPLSLALLTLGLHLGLVLFIHLGDVAPFVFSCLEFLYLIAVGWTLWNLVAVIEIGLARLTARTKNRLDNLVVPIIRRSLRIFLVVLFTLFVAQNVFGLDITGWLAGLGLAGLAVSLAAQDSVKNLFGWATVVFDRPFTTGDFVSYGGTLGTVEDISFRSTKLRMITGHLYTIPNMKWIDGTVENISARGFIRRDLNLSLPYNTPAEKVDEAVRIVEDILNRDPEVLADLKWEGTNYRPQVHFSDFKTDYLNIFVYYYYVFAGDPKRDYNAWLRNSQLINLKIMQRFEEAGIEFAFPTRTLFLAGDPNRELAVRMLPPADATT